MGASSEVLGCSLGLRISGLGFRVKALGLQFFVHFSICTYRISGFRPLDFEFSDQPIWTAEQIREIATCAFVKLFCSMITRGLFNLSNKITTLS